MGSLPIAIIIFALVILVLGVIGCLNKAHTDNTEKEPKHMNYKILKSHISASEIKYYEDVNPGWTVKTTNCLLVTFEDGTSTTYIIFEGPWTKADMCRDCGSYYEISIGNKIQKIPLLYD